MKKHPISDQVRKFIRNADETEYQIAMESGISKQTIYRFMNRERNLSLENLDKLAAYFGWQLKGK